jgi:hypothetical protein
VPSRGFLADALRAKPAHGEPLAALWSQNSGLDFNKSLCEEKVTLPRFIRSWAVHGVRDHLMADIVQFTFGGKRAPARR